MKVYIDCDLAVKFAQWGLLGRLTSHLTLTGKADLYTVPTLKYRFKLNKPDRAAAELGSMAIVKQLDDFVKACKAPTGHNAAVAEALTDIPSIDVGEAALFAAAAHYDAALVDTGDKKALRAVGGLANGNPARVALVGKLACLEQTVHYVIGRWTFDYVSAAVATHATADPSTHGCFKCGTSAGTLQSLQAKTDALAAECGLLHPTPFAWIP